jgi:hypothetical protein
MVVGRFCALLQADRRLKRLMRDCAMLPGLVKSDPKKAVDAQEGASTTMTKLLPVRLECHPWKDGCSLGFDGIQQVNIQTQRSQNGRCHLRSAHCGFYRAGFECRIGQ